MCNYIQEIPLIKRTLNEIRNKYWDKYSQKLIAQCTINYKTKNFEKLLMLNVIYLKLFKCLVVAKKVIHEVLKYKKSFNESMNF